jgi:hypothetical protein
VILEVLYGAILEHRHEIEEGVVGDAPAANGARGGTRRQFDVDEPLNGLHFIFVVFSASQQPTPRAREDM